MNTAQLLKQCEQAQIKFKVSGANELSYVCPKGALTENLRRKIIQFKPSIIEHLSDVDNVLATVCREYSITRDWLDQFVICPEDVEDIRNGDLPLSCLRAHIEYHIEDQRKWQERREEINSTYEARK